MAGAASQPTPGKPTEADDKEPRAGPPDRQVSCDPFLPPQCWRKRGQGRGKQAAHKAKAEVLPLLSLSCR